MRPLEYYLTGPKEVEEHRPTKTFSKKTQSQTSTSEWAKIFTVTVAIKKSELPKGEVGF